MVQRRIMESSNVKNSRLNEIPRSGNDLSKTNGINIATVAKDGNDDDIKNSAKSTTAATSGVVDTNRYSPDETTHEVSKGEKIYTSLEITSSAKSEDQDSCLSFFSNGPVFPARHNRDLQLSQSRIDLIAVSNHDGDSFDSESSSATKKAILSYIDTAEDDSVKKDSSKQHLSSLSFCQEPTDFLSGSSIANSGNSENHTKGASAAASVDGEVESLAPLNASFFNCQYQTPSWIDDPLIGVPPSAMENKNTHRKTGADMRILTAYMRSLNEMRLPEAIPPIELDKYLSSFFLVVRKADGSEYEPCSLRAMLASIERYLRFKNYPLSLTRDSAFSNMRNVLKLKQQTLRSIGKGQKTPSEVSPSSLAREGKIAHLFKSQEMGPYTPSSVVFTLCFYFCMYLRLRKSTENKKLLWGDIVLCKDDSGREFLTFSSQMLRRSQGSSKVNLRQRNYRVWADPSCPEKDPITIYKFYAQKRPASMNTNFAPFYLGINVLYPTQGQLWYRPAAMGINKLNEMVRQIRDITGVRSTSDFHSEVQVADKPASEADNNMGEDHSPANNFTDQQDCEADVKSEAIDEGEEDETNSHLAIDFNHEPPLDCSQHNESTQRGGITPQNSSQTPYSDGDNSNDSFSHQSFPVNVNCEMNADLGHSGDQDQEIDLTKGSSPDSPLNCSTKDRVNYRISDSFSHSSYSGCRGTEALSFSEAKQQLLAIVQKMEMTDILEFDHWLKGVKFSADPVSGQIMCRESVDESREGMSVKASSSNSPLGANITLNISLTPQALQGDGPITVTAHTSIPHEQQRNSTSSSANHNSKTCSQQSRTFQAASKIPSNFLLNCMPHQVASPSSGQSSPDKPLDLATSPVSRNVKSLPPPPSSSVPVQPAKSNRLPASNGMFSSSSSSGSSGHLDSPLAKRLRLSAEQAEAYTSASIMASLSSANFERLRLQLMQAGLRMGDYSVDAHTAGLMDLANSEALRSQLLQHYGIKTEPK